MNYLLIAGCWALTLLAALGFGDSYGTNRERASKAAMEKMVAETREAAQLGAADAIAKNKPQNNFIRGRVETIVRDNPVYRTCAHDADSLRNINEALTGRPVGTGGGVVPRVNAVN